MLTQALAGALSLGYSNKVLNIFMAILDEEAEEKKKIKSKIHVPDSFSDIMGKKLDGFVSTWGDDELEKIVCYLKEWNTNAKHSFVSQAVLNRCVSFLIN